MERETVLVTGAAGCVGSFAVEELLQAGFKVIAADLPGSAFPFGKKEDLEIREGDVTDESYVKEIVRGAGRVIHAAAIVDIGLPFSKLEPVNLSAVKNLYKASKDAGVKRFVFLSTGSIYDAEKSCPLREDSPLKAGNDYERTKYLAEEFFKARGSEEPAWTIVRPSLIYGPKGRVLLASMVSTPPIFRSLLPVLPKFSGGPRSNSVHGKDVARACIFLMGNDAAKYGIYNVADDTPISFAEIANITSEAFGIRLLPIAVPYPNFLIKMVRPLIDRDPLFEALNFFMKLGWGWVKLRFALRNELNPKIDRQMLDYAVGDVIFENSKLKALGFELSYPDFRKGWKETIEWYQRQGWAPVYPA